MLRLRVDVTHVDVEDIVTELDCISHNVECGFTSGLGWEVTEVEAEETIIVHHVAPIWEPPHKEVN